MFVVTGVTGVLVVPARHRVTGVFVVTSSGHRRGVVMHGSYEFRSAESAASRLL